MLGYLIWVLIFIYCLNRIIGWWILVFSKRWERYGIVVVLITVGVLLCLPFAPQPRLDSYGLLLQILGIAVGVMIFVGGLTIGIRAGQEFDKMGTREDRLPTKLVTTGIYSLVRHPQYLSLNICFVGWSLVWGAIYCIYLAPLIFFLNWLQAFLEEKYILAMKFGDEYRNYRREVGMFLPKRTKKG